MSLVVGVFFVVLFDCLVGRRLRALELVCRGDFGSSVVFSDWVVSVRDGSFVGWHVYKQAFSLVSRGFVVGRLEPVRAASFGGGVGEVVGRAWFREREGLVGPGWSGWLDLSLCRSDKDRVRLIMACDAPSVVKADLLLGVLGK